MSVLAGLVLCACAETSETGIQNEPSFVHLEDQNISASFTPSFGGRLTHFSVPGYESVVKFDHVLAANKPMPETSIRSGEPSYLGHSVWLSPQSEWWNQQDVNPKQRGQKWPPDPFLTLQPTEPHITDRSVVLSGYASPVSGVKITQSFELQKEGCLRVGAHAQNIRDTSVEWGIWFNTRVEPQAKILAPIPSSDFVRIGKNFSSDYIAAEFSYGDGVAFVDADITRAGVKGRRGKILMDPSAGWMAAMVKGQLFVVGFDLLSKADIHPDQGQVEFYFDQIIANMADGFIEMETHAALKKLNAGEDMEAVQYWTVRPYLYTNNLETITDDIKLSLETIHKCKRRSL